MRVPPRGRSRSRQRLGLGPGNGIGNACGLSLAVAGGERGSGPIAPAGDPLDAAFADELVERVGDGGIAQCGAFSDDREAFVRDCGSGDIAAQAFEGVPVTGLAARAGSGSVVRKITLVPVLVQSMETADSLRFAVPACESACSRLETDWQASTHSEQVNVRLSRGTVVYRELSVSRTNRSTVA